jgi:hypothetical protein
MIKWKANEVPSSWMRQVPMFSVKTGVEIGAADFDFGSDAIHPTQFRMTSL